MLLSQRLECRTNHSNKEYTVEIVQQPSGAYAVTARYGPIGRATNYSTKLAGESYPPVLKGFERLIAEKLRKGYVEIGPRQEGEGHAALSAPTAPPAPERPLLVHPRVVAQAEAERLLADRDALLQLSPGGPLLVLTLQPGQPPQLWHGAEEATLSAAARAELAQAKVRGLTQLIVQRGANELFVVDLVQVHGEDVGHRTLAQRLSRAAHVLPDASDALVRIAPFAVRAVERAPLLASLASAGGWGVLIRTQAQAAGEAWPLYPTVRKANVLVGDADPAQHEVDIWLLDRTWQWQAAGRARFAGAPPRHGSFVEVLYDRAKSGALLGAQVLPQRRPIAMTDCSILQLQ